MRRAESGTMTTTTTIRRQQHNTSLERKTIMKSWTSLHWTLVNISFVEIDAPPGPPGPPGAWLLLSVLLHGVEDTQHVEEEVDDVQVEVDGGQDVFLGGELLHQQVGVIDDESTEDQSSASSRHQLRHV